MRIVVDRDRCASSGMCTAIAPTHFFLTDSDELEVLQEAVEPAALDTIRAAVACCPMGAIRIDGAA